MQGSSRDTGLVPERVNQYPSGTHLPATAWPRQMRPSTGKGLVPERVNQYASGTHPPATAWSRRMRPSTGNGGNGRWLLALMQGSPRSEGEMVV